MTHIGEAYFYRFRSATSLLGDRKELEQGYIYFAAPSELNDPMEGTQDLFWKGDEVIWKSLFRNYLCSLLVIFAAAHIASEDFKIDDFGNVVFWNHLTLPTDALRELHNKIWENFCQSRHKKYPDILSNLIRPIRRHEVGLFLRIVHHSALMWIVNAYTERGLIGSGGIDTEVLDKIEQESSIYVDRMYALIDELGDEHTNSLDYDHIFHSMHTMQYQLYIINSVNLKSPQNLFLRLYHFPDHYVRNFSRLMYSQWYAACFVTDPTNASMWGTYGDAHRGACLRFKAGHLASGAPYLNLRRAVGWSTQSGGSTTTHYEYRPLEFTPMTYGNRFQEIDAFRSIGRLPLMQLQSEWFTDRDGTRSTCASEMDFNNPEWMRSYWKRFYDSLTIKFSDWKHENETRIILHSMLDQYIEKSERKLQYDISQFTGIIFGMNMTENDKIAIMRILDSKMPQGSRASFEFFQADFLPNSGKFQVIPLSLLKLSA